MSDGPLLFIIIGPLFLLVKIKDRKIEFCQASLYFFLRLVLIFIQMSRHKKWIEFSLLSEQPHFISIPLVMKLKRAGLS